MKKLFNSKLIWQVVVASLVATLATVGLVGAATTIGSNVTTAGTLNVTGTNTLYGATNIGGAITATSTLNVTGLTTLGNASTTLLTVGASDQLLLAPGSITDTSGAISFGNENLTTTGTLAAGATTITGNLSTSAVFNFDSASSTAGGTDTLKVATINSDTGAISFGNENLTTTGAINTGTASTTGLATLDSFKVSSTGSVVSGIRFGTCAVDPASINIATSSTAMTTSCAATGVTSSDQVWVTPPSDLDSGDNWLIFKGATASSTDGNISITLFNASTTVAVDGPSKTWSWMAIR